MCPANSPLAATLGQSILWRGVKEVKPLASLKLYLCMVGKFEARWWASILLMGRLRVPALCCSSQGRSWYSHLANGHWSTSLQVQAALLVSSGLAIWTSAAKGRVI